MRGNGPVVSSDGRPLAISDPVDRLKGIGPRLTAGLARENVRSVLDLLLHIPTRYEDRTCLARAAEVAPDGRPALLRGRVRRVRVHRRGRRGRGVVQAELVDDSGSLGLVWFNQTWISDQLKRSPEVFLYGPVRLDSRSRAAQLVNPEVEPAEKNGPAPERIVAVYRPLGPLGGRRVRKLVDQAVTAVETLEEPLPHELLEELDLPRLGEAIAGLHHPPVPDEEAARAAWLEALNAGATPGHRRLALNELLLLTGSVATLKDARRAQRARSFDGGRGEDARRLLHLPFRLTKAQERVVGEIRSDLARPYPMARLLQGDVGSGKTVVAALAAVAVLMGGGQVALMAPTELLAEQHLRSLGELFGPTEWTPRLLTGSLPAAVRREVIEALHDGTAGLVIGTQALIQESVAFDRLDLVIVDEQHRFGVAQRRALVDKGTAPHLLVMTATPIPRSLALTVYGDLDLSILDQLPPHRRPVRTAVRARRDAGRVFEYLRREAADGGRAYVVYPMIETSEEIEAEALEANEEVVRRALPGVRIGVLHGRMNREQREDVSSAFRRGDVQVLLATTVVEVGIDVPEASMILIESPERFGLSQLHQLRGRVGRGERPSWCVLLVGDRLPERARRRLEIFCTTNDGFRLAEADLELRGPGERTGLRQWGADGLRFANIFRDRGLLEVSRSMAERLAVRGELDGVLSRLRGFG